MAKESKAEKKKCSGRRSTMLAYGFIQLSTSIVSAISLLAIALSFCYLKQESRAFVDCIEEVRESGKKNSEAVHFCNGGN